MENQQDQITPKIECEELIHAGQDDDISDLFDIALDVIETGRASNLEGIKQWLVSYTYYKDVKETLHPDLFDAVIQHAIQQSNK